MGDTFRLIGLFSDEANKEAKRVMYTPMNYVNTNGEFTRGIAGEAGMTLYMLTR